MIEFIEGVPCKFKVVKHTDAGAFPTMRSSCHDRYEFSSESHGIAYVSCFYLNTPERAIETARQRMAAIIRGDASGMPYECITETPRFF